VTLASEPGRVLGSYELVRRIATGGMAELFLARHAIVPGRPLALKRMLPHLARDPIHVEMFLDEAYLASRLVHPHIVHVEDVCHGGPPYFYVMEYVRGADLLQLMQALAQRDEVVPIECAVAIAIAVCAALEHAHSLTDEHGRSLDIVHRDVSLANVLLGQDGSIKLTDFGIARIGRRRYTEPGMLKGKLGYMSPEQCTGAPVDGRSDLFSLGVVLHEITTGDRLFSPTFGATEVIERITTGGVTPPARLLPGYPPELSAIIMKALRRAPEERYQTARAMGRDLHTFQRLRRLPSGPRVIASLLQRAFPAASGRRSRQTQQLDELVEALRSIVMPTRSRLDAPASEDTATSALPEATPPAHRGLAATAEAAVEVPVEAPIVAPVIAPGVAPVVAPVEALAAPAPTPSPSSSPSPAPASSPASSPTPRTVAAQQGARRFLPALLAIALVVLGLDVSAWLAYEYVETSAPASPVYSSGSRAPLP
jgi:serine/threonine protein kinase